MAVLLLWIFYVFFSVLCLLCLCARLFKCALWSPAGKGLTSWLSFVVSYCEFVTFPLVSWVRCVTWLYRFLIFAPLLTSSLPKSSESPLIKTKSNKQEMSVIITELWNVNVFLNIIMGGVSLRLHQMTLQPCIRGSFRKFLAWHHNSIMSW